MLALPTLRSLLSSNHQIAGIITTPDRPAGRGQKIYQSELAAALAHSDLAKANLTIAKPQSDIDLRQTLQSFSPDVVITISYGKLIKEAELALPKHGWVNLHFSLLPRYRGAAPVQRALLDGASSTGVTVFKLDRGMDTGPIYRQREYPLQGRETTGDLLSSLATLGADEVMGALQAIEAGDMPRIQNEEKSSLAPKISTSEARISWGDDAEIIDRKIRAFHPKPGAWTTFRNRRVVITGGEVVPSQGSPGEITDIQNLVVATAKDSIRITSVIPEGKREMSAQEWARGLRISSNECFE